MISLTHKAVRLINEFEQPTHAYAKKKHGPAHLQPPDS